MSAHARKLHLVDPITDMSLNIESAEWGDVPDWAYSSVRSIMESLKAADVMTYFHCLRVGQASRKLAEVVGLSEYQQKVVEFAGTLHDVGKMGVDPLVLHKPGKLTDEELVLVKDHVIVSQQIIEPLTHHPFFKNVLPAVRGHHERVDGEGYPDKLVGDEIPLLSRVITVVDTVDAMAHNRSYRNGLPIEKIYQELKRCAGTQFDRQLIKIYLESHPHWKESDNESETLHKIIKVA